jgi:recombination protein RecA
MDVRKAETLKQGTDVFGSRTRVKVVKNKVAPPFKQAEFDLIHGEGISKLGSILDIGTDLGIITKLGTWYSYGDQRLGQGRENVREYLKNNPEIAQQIEAQVRQQVLSGVVKPSGADDSGEAQ